MARIGYIKCGCEGCGNPEASVSKTGTGTLSISCHRCEFSAFAKNGTKAHRLTLAKITMDEDQPSDPEPKLQPKTAKQTPVPDNVPQPKKPASVFSLGDLS